MSAYPDYVYKTLAQAQYIGQWYYEQADAAALCFDVLALFPDCFEASEAVLPVIGRAASFYKFAIAFCKAGRRA